MNKDLILNKLIVRILYTSYLLKLKKSIFVEIIVPYE